MRYARGLRITGLERNVYGTLKPPPLIGRGVDGPEPRSTAWEGAGPALGREPTAPSPNGAKACAPRAVGHGSAGRHWRTFFVNVFENFNGTFERRAVVLWLV